MYTYVNIVMYLPLFALGFFYPRSPKKERKMSITYRYKKKAF